MMIQKPERDLVQTDAVDISTSKSILEKPFLFCTLIAEQKEKVCLNTLEDMVDVVQIFSGCATIATANVGTD